MQGVEAMRSEIGRHAASVVPEPTISHEESVLIEGNGGRRPEIKVPIESWRGIRVRRSPNSFRRHVQVIPDSDEMHRSEEHTSELQSLAYLVCRLLLEKKKKMIT